MAIDTHGVKGKPWVGFDLDGTLATYDHWRGIQHIGEPVKPMCDLIKKLRDEGKAVKILTARVAPKDGDTKETAIARAFIAKWCKNNLGFVPPITHEKDSLMETLYDDRVKAVEQNTGKVLNMAKFKVGDKVYFHGRPATVKQVIREPDADYILDVQGDEFYAEDEEVTSRNSRAINSKWVILYRDGGKEKIEAPSHAEAKKIAEAKLKKSGRGYTSVIVDDGVDYGVNVCNAKFKAGDKAYVHWFSGEDELVDVISYEPKGDYYIVRGEDGQLAHPKASLLYPVKNASALNAVRVGMKDTNGRDISIGDSIQHIDSKMKGKVVGKFNEHLLLVDWDGGFQEEVHPSDIRITNSRACNSTNAIVRKAMNAVARNDLSLIAAKADKIAVQRIGQLEREFTELFKDRIAEYIRRVRLTDAMVQELKTADVRAKASYRPGLFPSVSITAVSRSKFAEEIAMAGGYFGIRLERWLKSVWKEAGGGLSDWVSRSDWARRN